MEYKSFTRKELYDLLTDKPITKLANEYGLAYADLKRVCIDNDIPFRSVDDWNRFYLGETVEREPFRGDPGQEVLVRRIGERIQKTKEKKKTYTNWYKKPDRHNNREEKTQVNNRTMITPIVDGYSVQNVNWDLRMAQRRLAEVFDYPSIDSIEMPQKEWIEISSNALTVRIAKFPSTATLYQILSVVPKKSEYEMLDVSKVLRTIRGINALKRNRINNLHELLMLTYTRFLGLRNNGIQTAYQIMKDILRYFNISDFVNEPDIIDSEAQQIQTSDEHEIEGKRAGEEENIGVKKSIEKSDRELTVDLLVAFNQMNIKGQQTLVDTARAFLSLEKYTKEIIEEKGLGKDLVEE